MIFSANASADTGLSDPTVCAVSPFEPKVVLPLRWSVLPSEPKTVLPMR